MKYLLLISLLSAAAVGWVDNRPQPVDRPVEMPQAPQLPVPRPTIPRLPYWLACPALVTAYSPHDPIDAEYVATKGADRWKTSTRVDVRNEPYGLAVDPRALPYDTEVVVPGYRQVSAPNAVYQPDDTGGKLRQTWAAKRLLHIDVRFATNYSANQWGVRYQIVWVKIHPGTEFERRMLAHNLRHQWLGRSLGLSAGADVPR